MAAAIRVYPELRRACRELRGVHPELRTVYAELRRTSIFSRLVSLSECLYAVSRSVNCAKLNRQTPELERIVSRRKQTAALCSNRQNFRFCLDEISTPLSSVGAREHARSLRPEWFRGAVPGTDAWLTCSDGKNGCGDHFLQFLPGTASQVESDVTHSKQSIPSFLPGATTAQCRLGQGTAFYVELRSAAARVNALRQGTALAVPSLVCPDEARCTHPNYSFRACLADCWRAASRSFRVNPDGIHPERVREGRAVVSGLNLAPAHIECAPFLTGSAPQTEIDATRSKQTTEKFLTGARTAFKQTENARSAHRFSRPAAPRNTGRGPRGTTSDQTASAPLPSPPPHAYVRLIANSMPARGKFIVLEGIDGSGKRTQLDMLARAFASRNVRFAQISFPRYDGFFGKLAARYLNGEFGSLEAVDAHFSALLYAGDRFEAKPAIESDLASGKTLLADRYIGSNLAHQGARVPREKRTEFLQWLRQLEYQVYALPAEDLVIYLRVPPAEAHRLIGEKGARDYTKLQRDISRTWNQLRKCTTISRSSRIG
jgi:dTMP kinase